MEISIERHEKIGNTMAALREERRPFWTLWRELAKYYLPKRYVWLESKNDKRVGESKNPYILDSTGTSAARILAAGMMNGVTSPSRPWLRLRVAGFDDEGSVVSEWADEVVRRMLLVMAESNFYNSMAVQYLDLVVFGTSAVLIYEDEESVIRCQNPALGEYYLGQDNNLRVNTFAREFNRNVGQIVTEWGIDNVSLEVKTAYKRGGAELRHSHAIGHLIEPNTDGKSGVPEKFAFRETYWELGGTKGEILAERGFNELPGFFPRWEMTANDSYGTCPAMDALPDVLQLQQETKRKAQGLDKTISPPIVADIQLEHRPTALLPNGVTFVSGANNVGAKPLYQINMPLSEMTQDIRDIQIRIRETFHNNLFNMISQLETVRSATEIDARKEEKLVLLGGVLERFENEALDPAVSRLYSIMDRAGLLPEAPEEIADAEIEIQYTSILSVAQRAVAAAPTERWLQLIGNISAITPEAAKIPDFAELIRNYGADIGVPAKSMRSREEVAEEQALEAQAAQQQQALEQASQVAAGAQQLSQTEVGGGANALQQLLAS